MSEKAAAVEMSQSAGSLAGVYTIVTVAVLLGGVNFPVTKIALRYLPALSVSEARFAGGAIVVLVLLWLMPDQRTPIRLRDIPILAAVGVSGFAASTSLINYSMLTATAGETAIITGISPVLTAMLAWPLLRERITLAKLAGLVLAFAGVTAITTAREGVNLSSEHMLAYLASMGSAISIAFFAIVGKVATRRYSPMSAIGYGLTAAALMLIPAVTISDGWQPFITAPVSAWLSIAYTVLVATVFTTIAWYSAVKRIGASNAAIFNNGITVGAVFSGVIILSEQVTIFHLIGLVLVIGGILLATRPTRGEARSARAVITHGR